MRETTRYVKRHAANGVKIIWKHWPNDEESIRVVRYMRKAGIDVASGVCTEQGTSGAPKKWKCWKVPEGTYNLVLHALNTKGTPHASATLNELGMYNYIRSLYGLHANPDLTPEAMAAIAREKAEHVAAKLEEQRASKQARRKNAKFIHAQNMLARAQKQLDSAEKRVRKWAAKVKYYERRGVEP